MGKCSVKLPPESDGNSLLSRLDLIIQEMGPLSESLLADAGNRFFRETGRWRYQATVEVDEGDQHIDLDIPEGLRCRVMDPIKLQQNDCDEYEIYERKDQDRSDNRNNGRGYDWRVWNSNCGRPLAFYTPHSNKILLSEPIEQSTIEIVLVLWPKTFDALDCIPETLMDDYRDGIVSLAVVNAMDMPKKPWTTPSEGYSPRQVRETNAFKANQAMEAARLFYSSNISSRRPHGDRMATVRNGQSSYRGYRGFGRSGRRGRDGDGGMHEW